MHCCFGVLVIAVPTCIFPQTLSPPIRRQSCRFLLSESSTFSAEQARRTDDIFMLLFPPLSLVSVHCSSPGPEGEPQGAAEREDGHPVPLHAVAGHGRARVCPARAHLRQEILSSQNPGHGTSGGALQVQWLGQNTHGKHSQSTVWALCATSDKHCRLLTREECVSPMQ